MKRAISFLLVIMLLLTCLPPVPITALAADIVDSGTCGDNLTWTLDSEGTLTISGTGAMYDYYDDDNSPTDSSHPWKNVAKSIEKVVIANGVTSIGDYAFCRFSNLTAITIPDSVTSIGRCAFSGCYDLTDITIPDSVTSIGDSAFEGCSSLTAITIPDGVTSIGDYAFCGCSSLTAITIPDSVTSIGEYAFYVCDSLIDITIPDSVTSIGYEAFFFCSSLKSITIGNSVTSIGAHAFFFCSSLKSITIGNSVTSIGDGAFYECSSLTDITIPDSVTSIGSYAFFFCSSLKSITIPDSVTSIGDEAFYECSSLTDITIPDGVTSIGEGAFYYCSSLTAITIPDSVTSIGDSAFEGCDNLNFSIFGNGKYLGNENNPYIYLADVISDSITSFAIPENTKFIGDSAFYGCSSLTTITIPDSVTSIGAGAFSGCSSLTAITIPDSVASIGKSAFRNCANLTDITIPDSVTSIGDSAFSGCSSLKSVTIPDSVTSIGGYAFYDCSSLTAITIPDSVTSIGRYAFRGCSRLKSITIPDGVTSIGEFAFYVCYSLTAITIPDGVTSIGDYAFGWCDDLENVYYSGTQAQWGAIAIGADNEYLTDATIHYNHIHDYTLIDPVVVPATCTQAGCIEYTCAYGETKREVLKPLGHTAGTNAVITAPTCTEQGYTTSNCATCGVRVDTDYVGAIGHDYTGEVVTKQPTCTEQGYTGPKCTRCDSVRQDTVVTDCLGHKIVAGGNVAPTCTEKGHTGGTVCQNCNIWFVQPTWSDAMGHSFTNYVSNGDGTMTAVCDNCDTTETIDAMAASIGANLYSTLKDALIAVQAGETVKLLMDANVEEVLLTGGVTLDLNGCTLTVDAFTGYAEDLADGCIIDSSAGNTGLLVVEKEKATFKSNNPDMPLYDEKNGGYRFFDYKLTLHSKPTNVDTGKEKFWFKFHFYTDDTCTELDSDAYGIVAAGGSGMEVRTALTWKGKELPKVLFAKDGSADTFVKDWADDAIAARWLYVIVSGLDKVGDGTLLVKPMIISNGVTVSGGNIRYVIGEDNWNVDFGWNEDGPIMR